MVIVVFQSKCKFKVWASCTCPSMSHLKYDYNYLFSSMVCGISIISLGKFFILKDASKPIAVVDLRGR